MRRFISPQDAAAYMRQHGLPPDAIVRPIGAAPPQRALGDYGENDPNIANENFYSEGNVFRARQGQLASELQSPPAFRNTQNLTVYPFTINSTSGTNGSVSILPVNERRTLLLVQNQSTTANLYFNLSGDASANGGILLTPGSGFIFDYMCPRNAVAVFMDSATNEPGCIAEASPLM